MKSYAKGETATPLLSETIGECLERTATRYSESEALVEAASGRRWTWAELNIDVNDLARGFLAAGLKKGDRLGIWAPNCAEWTLVQFATAKIGVILVNVNPAYRTHEFVYAVNHSGMRMLVAASSFKSSDYKEMIEQAAGATPSLERVVYIGTEDWANLINSGGTLDDSAVS